MSTTAHLKTKNVTLFCVQIPAMNQIITILKQDKTKFYLKATLLSLAVSAALFLVYELTNLV